MGLLTWTRRGWPLGEAGSCSTVSWGLMNTQMGLQTWTSGWTLCCTLLVLVRRGWPLGEAGFLFHSFLRINGIHKWVCKHGLVAGRCAVGSLLLVWWGWPLGEAGFLWGGEGRAGFGGSWEGGEVVSSEGHDVLRFPEKQELQEVGEERLELWVMPHVGCMVAFELLLGKGTMTEKKCFELWVIGYTVFRKRICFGKLSLAVLQASYVVAGPLLMQYSASYDIRVGLKKLAIQQAKPYQNRYVFF